MCPPVVLRRGPVEPLVHRCVKFRAAEGSAPRPEQRRVGCTAPGSIGTEFPGARGLVAERADSWP